MTWIYPKRLLNVALSNFIIVISTSHISANDRAIKHNEPISEIVYEASFWGGLRINHISLTYHNYVPRLKVWVTFDVDKSKGKPRTRVFVVPDSVWNEAVEILKQPPPKIDPLLAVPQKKDVTFNLMIFTGPKNAKKIYRNKVNSNGIIQYLKNTASNYTDILNE
jgi:hypothetical protein